MDTRLLYHETRADETDGYVNSEMILSIRGLTYQKVYHEYDDGNKNTASRESDHRCSRAQETK